uniref:Uncharacterized protein n=1 Tax=Triticum urartu TaxID=4572 RepID=A0A8R7Q2K3_TRIUA
MESMASGGGQQQIRGGVRKPVPCSWSSCRIRRAVDVAGLGSWRRAAEAVTVGGSDMARHAHTAVVSAGVTTHARRAAPALSSAMDLRGEGAAWLSWRRKGVGWAG